MMEDKLSYMRTEAPLLAPIFRSDGQARLLSTLLLTGDELSLTDLAERAGLAYPTAHREVGRLLDSGIPSAGRPVVRDAGSVELLVRQY